MLSGLCGLAGRYRFEVEGFGLHRCFCLQVFVEVYGS